jgi:hypothetical protein
MAMTLPFLGFTFASSGMELFCRDVSEPWSTSPLGADPSG